MGWETTPITKGLFMDTIKLERNGKIVTRSKADYEMNKLNYDLRGFKEYTEKPKPKPEPKPEQVVKPEVKEDGLSSDWVEEEKPKKKQPNKPVSQKSPTFALAKDAIEKCNDLKKLDSYTDSFNDRLNEGKITKEEYGKLTDLLEAKYVNLTEAINS